MKQVVKLLRRALTMHGPRQDGCHAPRLWPHASSLLAAGLLTVAQLVPSAARAEELSGSVTLYGWLPWIDGEVSSNSGGSIKTSLSAGDVLDALKFAFFVAGDVHYGRIGLVHDTVYADFGSGGSLSGPFSADVDVDTTAFISTTALGYQVYSQNGWMLEPFAGARYVDLEADVKITGGGPIGASISASRDANYWEPVIGLRGQVPLSEKLTGRGFVDIGGFGAGSEFTWEVFAGLDYAFTNTVSAVAGFRYLSIDYEAEKGDIDLDLYGPVLGLTVRF